MFKLEYIKFFHENEYQQYPFTKHTFVYGRNTVGKTALTKVIDYILGGSEGLSYQGLDNIDAVEALLRNNQTCLWIKRTIVGNYFYKRTIESQFTEVSSAVYKDNIRLIISNNSNNHYLDVYSKVFDENPSFRSFTFLNYIEEKGLGDLSIVFTKARELKHQIRIRNIMDFFFNYDNIEQIYEKSLRLEQAKKELADVSKSYQEYSRSISKAKKLFSELQLNYTGDYTQDYKTFSDFRLSFVRKAKAKSKDLVYLSKASFSLSEEIKLYSFMRNQSENMIERKDRIKRLLTFLDSIVNRNPEYKQYTSTIEKIVTEIGEEKIILSLTDYNKTIREIEAEKKRIDDQIEHLRNQATELTYEAAVKKVGLLEHLFSIICQGFDEVRYNSLNNEVMQLNNSIRVLKASFNQHNIKNFNRTLTDLYLHSGLDVKHLNEDLIDSGFCLEFDPFKLCLFAYHEEGDHLKSFVPGSMTRQTHLQMLAYLCMFGYLRENFPDFICLPLLIIDSANQPMGIDVFEKVYPTIIAIAEKYGIQTIFMSKDLLYSIDPADLVDISSGLNRFHQNAD